MSGRERVLLQAAYVLHHYDWRETSQIVEIFSRDYGRLGLVARGARRPGSPWRGLLQPFRPLWLSWSGGGELGTLAGAEATGLPWPLAGPVLLSGFYLNELLLRLLPRRDPQPALYAAYVDTLACLMREPAPALRIFEKRLLAALGYGLLLREEAGSGAPIQPATHYRYDLERGPLPLSAAGSAEGPLVHGATLLALAAERFDDPRLLAEARRLLGAALERQLGGRSLRTREVLSALKRVAV